MESQRYHPYHYQRIHRSSHGMYFNDGSLLPPPIPSINHTHGSLLPPLMPSMNHTHGSLLPPPISSMNHTHSSLLPPPIPSMNHTHVSLIMPIQSSNTHDLGPAEPPNEQQTGTISSYASSTNVANYQQPRLPTDDPLYWSILNDIKGPSSNSNNDG
jgi:hypothetical protein